jgi:protein arginine kinase activator
MLCSNCNKRGASIHITKFVDGKKSEIFLCDQCAKEAQHVDDDDIFSFQNLVAGILNPNTDELHDENKNILKCDNCGLTYDEFSNKGLVGCEKCYETFDEKLSPLIKRIHGSSRHIGKIPNDKDKYIQLRRDIKELKKEMEKVIEKENFERAAELRDEIYALEKKIGSE